MIDLNLKPPPSPFRLTAAPLLLVALPLVLAVACLAALGPLGGHPWSAALAYVGAFGCLALGLRLFPADFPDSWTLALVLGLGLAARLAFLWAFPPGSDLARCVWEGYIQTQGFNPYALAPDHPVLAVLARGEMHEVWSGVNHKSLTAIYPPLAQLLFRATAHISATPGAVRLLMLAADLGAGLALIPILRGRGLPLSRLALYWLNPLVLVFFSGEGHVDALVVLFLALGLASFQSDRDGPGFFCLGCAVLCKYTILPVLPLFLTARNWPKAALALVTTLCFLPFMDAGMGLFESLLLFGRSMWYNDSLLALLRLILGPYALTAAALLLALALAAIFLLARDREHGAFLACGATLLFLPSLHPWYLGVMALFLPLFPSAAWLLLQAAMALTFPTLAGEQANGLFQEQAWLRLPEYLPFFGLLVWEARRGQVLAPGRTFAPVSALSIIVPTLNEAGRITGCLKALAQARPVLEIIVADGGSGDSTREEAETLGGRVVLAPPGRGSQIATGLAQVRGDCVLILHADCLLAPEAPGRILASLNARPESPGGCLGMRFEPGQGRSRLIEGLNALRADWFHLSFGDQGQFFRTQALPLAGGFPVQALMEDLELSLRLKTLGPPLYLGHGVAASARRWAGPGFWAKMGRVLGLFFRYLAERRLGLADPTGMRYYRRYYGQGPGAMDQGSENPR